MKSSEVKKIIVQSLDPDNDTREIAGQLEKNGICFDFNDDFTGKVMNSLSSDTVFTTGETEFRINLNKVFYRIALTGIAAIIILMISIYIAQDSFSFNSLLGLGDTYDESIVCLLTGN